MRVTRVGVPFNVENRWARAVASPRQIRPLITIPWPPGSDEWQGKEKDYFRSMTEKEELEQARAAVVACVLHPPLQFRG